MSRFGIKKEYWSPSLGGPGVEMFHGDGHYTWIWIMPAEGDLST